MTSVGRCTCSTSQAVVADLPVPVAPSRTTSFSPALIRSASSLIAVGWSPDGSKSLTTRNVPWVGRMSVLALTRTTVRRWCDRNGRQRSSAPTGAGGESGTHPLLVLGGAAPLACLLAGAVPDRGPAPPGLPGRGRTPERGVRPRCGVAHRGRPAPRPPAAALAGPAHDAPRGPPGGCRRIRRAPPVGFRRTGGVRTHIELRCAGRCPRAGVHGRPTPASSAPLPPRRSPERHVCPLRGAPSRRINPG
jgi:hypothetical protein